MTYLLDTNVWLYGANEPDKLPKDIQELLDERNAQFGLSAISLWEVGKKHQHGKLTLNQELGLWLRGAVAAHIQLLPLTPENLKADAGAHAWDYIYEPDAQAVIDELLVRYVEALVYQAVAENMASEQSARMVAMKSATDNAGSVIGELKLIYNKTRQAAITKELSEIVSGAAAIGA